jgi:MFS family permease
MILASNRVEVVLAAIFVAGLSLSTVLINMAYIIEISQESIRGAMAGGIMVFFNIGMLLSYILGGQLSYSTMVCTSLTLSVISVLLLFFLKESPLFLLSKGREEVSILNGFLTCLIQRSPCIVSLKSRQKNSNSRKRV